MKAGHHKKLSAAQKHALMDLRTRYQREGLRYLEDWAYVATSTLNTAGKLPASFKASSPVAPMRALSKAGAVEMRERTTGHRDGRTVLEVRFTRHGVDVITGRAD